MLHQIGVGALGPVFRTYEPTRDRLVAVKVFRLDITPEQAQALADELSAATQAGLFHPSIVEPIAAGVEGSVAYRAEEYVAAESLDVAMRHYAPAAADKVLPFISQLAAAIDFARDNGIGHGALHPRDIFVTPDEARATGFGVVEALERVGLRAPVRRPYSAPERVAGEKWSTAADVFSLGAIAYELLTGRRPAGVGTAIGDLSGASVGERAEGIQTALVRAMDENPSARFPTAMAFAAALEAASRGKASDAVAYDFSGKEDSAVAAFPSEQVLPPEEVLPPPPFDDITPEQEEDEAFFALTSEERAEGLEHEKTPARDLFDIEAVEDGALDPSAERFKDDFNSDELDEERPRERFASAVLGAEPEETHRDNHVERYRDTDHSDDAARRGYVSPPRLSIDYVPDDSSAVTAATRRRMWPLAIMLLIGLLIGFGAGFGAGYGAGSRNRSAATLETQAEPADERPAGQAQAKGDAGKAYSEQAVTPQSQKPAAEPPPIPGDAPPPPGATTPPPTRTDAGATAGRLIVRSVPANAGVTVDGTWRGRTPLTLEKLALGSHEVRVVQPGFAVARQTIALTQSAPARTLSIRLQPEGTPTDAPSRTSPTTEPPVPTPPVRSDLPPVAPEPRGPGSLYVDSRPRGAAVLLDGKRVGVTPMVIPDVTAGPHVIRLELPEHRVWIANTQVVPGQQARVTGSLERIQ